MNKRVFDDLPNIDVELQGRRWHLTPSTACHQCLLILIFCASITLMSLEVLYIQHIRRKGPHLSIFIIEIILDILIFADVIRRARKSKNCTQYMYNMWNWLDLLTVWIVAIHWIVVIVDPLVQVYSDAWIVLRYSINSARIIYWMVRNLWYFRYRYYRKVADDHVGDLEWLPVQDLTMEPEETNELFDDPDAEWDPKRMGEPQLVIQQFKAPNAVNATEVEKREKKEKEEKEAIEEAKRAEEARIDHILGPEDADLQHDDSTKAPVYDGTEASKKATIAAAESFSQAAAAFEVAALKASLSLEEPPVPSAIQGPPSLLGGQGTGLEVMNDIHNENETILFDY